MRPEDPVTTRERFLEVVERGRQRGEREWREHLLALVAGATSAGARRRRATSQRGAAARVRAVRVERLIASLTRTDDDTGP
jgi:hypothetical protein